jgi:hypothetical protein
MDEELIRKTLEELDVPQEKIDEAVIMMKKPLPLENVYGEIQKNDLRSQLSFETDWKKRAQLAARIISFDLD